MEEICLASGSPRRRELLDQIAVGYAVHAPEIDESPNPGENPIDLARRLARQKAEAVRHEVGHRLILAADTVVFLDDHVLGKPVDREDARRMLQTLSGRTHAVVSAIALYNRDTDHIDVATGITKVLFALLDEAEIDWYLDSEEWHGVAGGYRIQNRAAALITAIHGEYATVVGLPIRLLYSILRRNKYLLP